MSYKIAYAILLTIIILFNVVYLINELNKKEEITSFSIANVAIIVQANIRPNPYIVFPLNTTYNFQEGIPFQFYVIKKSNNIDKKWYGLNNDANVTITDNTTIHAKVGQNILTLYTNDTSGLLNSTFVRFVANESDSYEIDYGYYSMHNGTTTNFSSFNKFDQEKIENLTLEIPGYGKIVFSTTINLSSNGNGFQTIGAKKVFNFSNFTNISDKKIKIDSSYVPQLNQSATLYMYNLTLTNPKIERDGETCSLSICVISNYIEGDLTFTVPYFSEYEAVESSSLSHSSSTAVPGRKSRDKEVVATGLAVDKDKKEPKREDKNIDESEPLFDFKISILEYSIMPGSDLSIKVEMYNFGNLSKRRIIIDYKIRNENEAIILDAIESFNITSGYIQVKKFKMPENISEGRYIVDAKASYDGKNLVSSDSFYIVKELDYWKNIKGTLIIMAFLLVIYIISKLIKRKESIFKFLKKH